MHFFTLHFDWKRGWGAVARTLAGWGVGGGWLRDSPVQQFVPWTPAAAHERRAGGSSGSEDSAPGPGGDGDAAMLREFAPREAASPFSPTKAAKSWCTQ